MLPPFEPATIMPGEISNAVKRDSHSFIACSLHTKKGKLPETAERGMSAALEADATPLSRTQVEEVNLRSRSPAGITHEVSARPRATTQVDRNAHTTLAP